MTMKNYAKFVEELTCHFKVDIRNLKNFDPSTSKVKSFHFNVPLLSKVYIVWAKKYREVISWNWMGIQNLDRNRVAISKLAKGIWQILTWALKSLKSFHFKGLLLSKLYILWAEKVQRSYLSWNWRGIQNLERNWLVISNLT